MPSDSGMSFGMESDPAMPKSCSLLRVTSRRGSLPVMVAKKRTDS